MPHQHDAAAFERVTPLLERPLDGVAVRVRGLLQLAYLQRPVGAEEDRFEGRRRIGHAAGARISTWIGPKRSFCLTLMTERRISSSTATKVTTASRRSTDSRINSTSSMGP